MTTHLDEIEQMMTPSQRDSYLLVSSALLADKDCVEREREGMTQIGAEGETS